MFFPQTTEEVQKYWENFRNVDNSLNYECLPMDIDDDGEDERGNFETYFDKTNIDLSGNKYFAINSQNMVELELTNAELDWESQKNRRQTDNDTIITDVLKDLKGKKMRTPNIEYDKEQTRQYRYLYPEKNQKCLCDLLGRTEKIIKYGQVFQFVEIFDKQNNIIYLRPVCSTHL